MDRRSFLKDTAVTVVSASFLVRCASKTAAPEANAKAPDANAPPTDKPADWDPIAFNTARGKAGFIPEKYMADILAPGGTEKHLGKHLPYVAKLDPARIAAGTVPIMYGDTSKGYAAHPNAAKTPEKPDGHWFNWIKVAIAGKPESEVESHFSDWPTLGAGDNGKLAGFSDPDPSKEDGKNTVYLAALPEGAKAGDVLRVWGHCLTHGEYVDFLVL
ncbi:MAG: twin-arginine translocation signal domain-containing protein [Myxococcota bacterium]